MAGFGDLTSKCRVKTCIMPQTFSNNTVSGTGIDLKNFMGCTFFVAYGSFASGGAMTLTVQESATNGAATWSDVANADLIGTESPIALTKAAGQTTGVSAQIGYKGQERYVRMKAVEGATANADVAVIAVVHDPEDSTSSCGQTTAPE